jgi:virulence factor Mce-like protein
VLFILYTKPSIPLLSGGGTEYAAEVDSGVNIRPGRTPVRVAGVDVGQVTDVKRNPSGRGALVEFRVDDGMGVEVKQDAALSMRWRTLLGRNLYLDLVPGSRSAPPIGDRVIPRSRTSTQVELDQVLEPLDDGGRKAVKTILGEFDRGFADPAGPRRVIDATAPTMRRLAAGLVGLRGTKQGDLTELVRSASRAMGALSSDEVALGGLVDDGRTALAVTAAHSSAIGRTLRAAPGAMSQTRSTMARLRTTLDVLDPFAERLRPGARKLPAAVAVARQMLDAATPLLRDARPTLRALRPAVIELQGAARNGNAVIRDLTPVLDRTQAEFLPFLEKRNTDTKLKTYETVGPTLSSVSSAFSWGDKYGTFANFEPGVGLGAVAGLGIGGASVRSSPCNKLLGRDASRKNKVNCELATRLISSLFTHRPVDDIKVRDSAVSESVLRPLLANAPKGRGR